MNTLVWIDWTILGVVGLSALLSLTRGFMREAISLLALLVAVVVARLFSGQVELLLAGWIASAPLRSSAAFALLFLGVLVLGGILGRLLGHLLRVSGLGMFDRLLGMAFGVVRGLVIVVLLAAALEQTPATASESWISSRLLPHLLLLADWGRHTLLPRVAGAITDATG